MQTQLIDLLKGNKYPALIESKEKIISIDMSLMTLKRVEAILQLEAQADNPKPCKGLEIVITKKDNDDYKQALKQLINLSSLTTVIIDIKEAQDDVAFELLNNSGKNVTHLYFKGLSKDDSFEKVSNLLATNKNILFIDFQKGNPDCLNHLSCVKLFNNHFHLLEISDDSKFKKEEIDNLSDAQSIEAGISSEFLLMYLFKNSFVVNVDLLHLSPKIYNLIKSTNLLITELIRLNPNPNITEQAVRFLFNNILDFLEVKFKACHYDFALDILNYIPVLAEQLHASADLYVDKLDRYTLALLDTIPNNAINTINISYRYDEPISLDIFSVKLSTLMQRNHDGRFRQELATLISKQSIANIDQSNDISNLHIKETQESLFVFTLTELFDIKQQAIDILQNPSTFHLQANDNRSKIIQHSIDLLSEIQIDSSANLNLLATLLVQNPIIHKIAIEKRITEGEYADFKEAAVTCFENRLLNSPLFARPRYFQYRTINDTFEALSLWLNDYYLPYHNRALKRDLLVALDKNIVDPLGLFESSTQYKSIELCHKHARNLLNVYFMSEEASALVSTEPELFENYCNAISNPSKELLTYLGIQLYKEHSDKKDKARLNKTITSLPEGKEDASLKNSITHLLQAVRLGSEESAKFLYKKIFNHYRFYNNKHPQFIHLCKQLPYALINLTHYPSNQLHAALIFDELKTADSNYMDIDFCLQLIEALSADDVISETKIQKNVPDPQYLMAKMSMHVMQDFVKLVKAKIPEGRNPDMDLLQKIFAIEEIHACTNAYSSANLKLSQLKDTYPELNLEYGKAQHARFQISPVEHKESLVADTIECYLKALNLGIMKALDPLFDIITESKTPDLNYRIGQLLTHYYRNNQALGRALKISEQTLLLDELYTAACHNAPLNDKERQAVNLAKRRLISLKINPKLHEKLKDRLTSYLHTLNLENNAVEMLVTLTGLSNRDSKTYAEASNVYFQEICPKSPSLSAEEHCTIGKLMIDMNQFFVDNVFVGQQHTIRIASKKGPYITDQDQAFPYRYAQASEHLFIAYLQENDNAGQLLEAILKNTHIASKLATMKALKLPTDNELVIKFQNSFIMSSEDSIEVKIVHLFQEHYSSSVLASLSGIFSKEDPLLIYFNKCMHGKDDKVKIFPSTLKLIDFLEQIRQGASKNSNEKIPNRFILLINFCIYQLVENCRQGHLLSEEYFTNKALMLQQTHTNAM